MTAQNTNLSDSDVNQQSEYDNIVEDASPTTEYDAIGACAVPKHDNGTLTADAAPCRGRSMVEMLGVLAIIGVLSVGAIAGYSKAMTKYKLNKQAEQLSTVINAVATYGLQIKSNPVPVGSSSSISIIPVLNKLNYIPKEMLKNNQNDYIYDVFNSQIKLDSGYITNPVGYQASIILTYLFFLITANLRAMCKFAKMF